ncbi:MAG TPA: helix-turn-helix domain-containing protein [Solirubrobacteraceae bacterium]|jgi:excisionase family DNA binding protein|nr:helix-turn-helix domain-containing protein [Solirubrobacteraceae bacterium]
MEETRKALFVRLAPAETNRLDQAVATTGKSKRQLITEAVREHLTDDGLVVGRVSLRPNPDEVMTLGEAAGLLKLDETALLEAAERGELPARRLAGEWRFSRTAVLAWLDPGRPPTPA